MQCVRPSLAPMLLVMLGCVPPADSQGGSSSLRAGGPADRADPPATASDEPSRTVDAEPLPSLWSRRPGADWPGFLGPRRDSKSAEQGLRIPWPAEGPPLVWQRQVGAGYAIGSVCGGRYYHFDREEGAGVRTGSARLTCLHAETGEELWRFEYPCDYEDMLGYDNGPRCSPLLDGNRVYLFDPQGSLFCVRIQDGKPLWNVDTQAAFGVVQNFFGVGSSPIVVGDLLICMVGGSPAGSPGLYVSGGRVSGNGSGIVAFDKYSGAVRYKITDELASYASPQVATINGRPWCFVLARGGLVGFDPRSGQVDFEYPWRASLLESVNASTPVVVGSEVLISECYQVGSALLSVRPGGYDMVWKDDRRRREKSLKCHWNTPIYVDGYLYGCSGRNLPDADLRCVEWKTGKVVWVHRTNPLQRVSLLYVDGHFICLGEKGTLQLIKVNPARCEIVSEVKLRDATNRELLREPCWAAPILSHGLLYLRGRGRIVCLEVIPSQTP